MTSKPNTCWVKTIYSHDRYKNTLQRLNETEGSHDKSYEGLKVHTGTVCYSTKFEIIVVNTDSQLFTASITYFIQNLFGLRLGQFELVGEEKSPGKLSEKKTKVGKNLQPSTDLS